MGPVCDNVNDKTARVAIFRGMNSVVLVILGLSGFALAYAFYSKFLAEKVFGLDPERKTPAHEKRDDVDYVPTGKHVLFGHHFTSIAGAAPILGPAIAVIWGWLPALLWIVFGTVFIGAVHDFGCLFLSTRNGGTTVADLTGKIVGPRARILFLLLVFCLAWIVIAVFAVVIGTLFTQYPETVLPVNFEIVVACVIGVAIYRLKAKLLVPSLIALGLLYAMVWVGAEYTGGFEMPTPFAHDDTAASLASARTKMWVVLLLGYSFVASVLPVWVLLQPRDYINSHQLFVGLGAMYLGVLWLHPPVAAPALNLSPAGSGPWFPILFITIACGAISGFHGLVGSGTTSKQVDNEADTRAIGYGSMLGEGALALMSLLCCTAGIAGAAALTGADGAAAWAEHYSTWASAKGLGPKLGAFVEGGAFFLGGLGLGAGFAKAVIAVVVISFAATTLDTATRIQRFILQEISSTYSFKPLGNRYVASVVAAFLPLILVFGGSPKPYWLELWPIFGASNQMLGALCLLVLTFYLVRRGKNYWIVAVPCVFLTLMTVYAMLVNLTAFWEGEKWLLVGLTVVLLVLSVWILLEGALTLRRIKQGGVETDAALE
jgi:carbon starvation protein